ncbi:hypothetical protein [Clostridium perfringens]|uniref:Uncharacterized protein n=1 Tax=Clostridium perfringens TaxID=1502 RepID=A0A140GRG6_CLOPF|nr:hypothetical protein [Clostridium perfringens]AMN31125.1 hypothetical protein JFP838_pA0209 [Clostridium perfringens]
MNKELLNTKGLEILKYSGELIRNKGNKIVTEALLEKIDKEFSQKYIDLIKLSLTDTSKFEEELFNDNKLKKNSKELDEVLFSKLKQKLSDVENSNIPDNIYFKKRYKKIYAYIPIILGANFINDYLITFPNKENCDENLYDELFRENGFLDIYINYRYISKFKNLINNYNSQLRKRNIHVSIDKKAKRTKNGYEFTIEIPLDLDKNYDFKLNKVSYAKFISSINRTKNKIKY